MSDDGELLSFTTATREADPELDGNRTLRFLLDGEELTAVRPKDSAFMFLAIASARTASLSDKINAVATFLDVALDERSSRRVHDRMMDPEDALELEDLIPILETIISRWVGSPNGGQPGSSAGQRRTGPKPTARVSSKAST